MRSHLNSSRNKLILSMCIFSTIGILRKYIPYSSALIAAVRGLVGGVFLILILLLRKQSINRWEIQKSLLTLLLSGAAIGFNWIFLFEAYQYTSVAVATLCYYMAPILVILFSSLFLKESLSLKKVLCIIAALVGMSLVSGVTSAGFSGWKELKGIFFGLAAAILYASVILLNKQITVSSAYDKTIIQLLAASAALWIYIVFSRQNEPVGFQLVPVLLLIVAGILHTGVAYALYFGSMSSLPAQTIAMLSYIDPILAVILSALFLSEPMTFPVAFGAVLILGAAIISETGIQFSRCNKKSQAS